MMTNLRTAPGRCGTRRGAILRLAAVAAAAAGLSACGHAPRGPAPMPLEVPTGWIHAARAVSNVADAPVAGAWWQRYGDAALDGLIAAALEGHGDLKSAALRLRNAAYRVESAEASRWPAPGGNVGVNASRALSGPNTALSRSASTGISVGWELDLYGRLRLQRDMAQWEADATAGDAHAVAAALVANIARQHWQLAALNQRLSSAQASLDHARRTVAMTLAQYEAGSVSGLDLAQARQSVQAQEQALEALRQQRTEARHSLTLLIDRPPAAGPAPGERATLPAEAALRLRIAPDLPAEVLMRRPDLQAAERRLRATLANVDVQRGALLPGLSLTAGLGTSSTALVNLLANPSASLGLALSLPFLNWAQVRRNPLIAENEHAIAVQAYRQSLLRALNEVENALSQVATLRDALQRQTQSVALARRIESMTEVRYRAGAIPLRTWLDTQESRRQAELAEVDAQLNLLVAQVTLFQALGEGPN